MRALIAGAVLGASSALALAPPLSAQTSPPPAPAQESARTADIRNAGELARICAAEANTATAQYYEYGYCFGFASGALGYHRAITPANAPPLFCAPDPPPSFETLRGQYVGWVNSAAANQSMRAVDSVFAFLRATYPCPTPPPARAPARRR